MCLARCSLRTRAADWPGWRGPDGNGVSPEKNLPVAWSATENVRWKVPLPGAGVSTPVVWGDRIFLTASDGRLNDRLHVYCYHRDDGRLLWHARFFGSAQPEGQFPPGGMAVPTPATDGKHVYALFGTGDLVCLDFDGKPVWMRSLAQEYGPFRNRWGMGASPILVGDLLVVQVDHWGQSYLLGVDAATGANRWKTDRDASVNWTSPAGGHGRAARRRSSPPAPTRCKGYDAADGAELWTVDGMQMQCIPSPVVQGDLLYAVSGRKGYTLAIRLDGSRGDLTRRTSPGMPPRRPFMPSPVCLRRATITGRGQRLRHLPRRRDRRASTGGERLGGRYQASPVAGDGKVYFTSLDGVVTVVKAGPKFEVLAQNDLGEGIVASPAISKVGSSSAATSTCTASERANKRGSSDITRWPRAPPLLVFPDDKGPACDLGTILLLPRSPTFQ